MKLSITNKGYTFEKQAARYLKKKGLIILETNFHSRFGEVDIIATHGDFMVFIEVKGRAGLQGELTPKTETDTTFNSSFKQQISSVKGFQYVDSRKINKLIKTSQIYMIKKNYCGLARFDILSIDNNEITHIENAFGI